MCRLQGLPFRKAGCTWVAPQALLTRFQLPLEQGLLTLSMAHPVCHTVISLHVKVLCVQGGEPVKEDQPVSRRAAAGCAGTALSFLHWSDPQAEPGCTLGIRLCRASKPARGRGVSSATPTPRVSGKPRVSHQAPAPEQGFVMYSGDFQEVEAPHTSKYIQGYFLN